MSEQTTEPGEPADEVPVVQPFSEQTTEPGEPADEVPVVQPFRTASIDIGKPGVRGNDRVVIDGHPLADVTCGLTLTAGAGELSTLELNVLLLDGVRVDGEVEVKVPDESRAALVRLGWKPPDYGAPPRRRTRPDDDSPAEGLDFGQALVELLDGERVTRVAWRGRRWVVLVPGSTITVSGGRPLGDAAPELIGQQVSYRSHLDMFEDGLVGPWSPTDADQLARDWKIL